MNGFGSISLRCSSSSVFLRAYFLLVWEHFFFDCLNILADNSRVSRMLAKNGETQSCKLQLCAAWSNTALQAPKRNRWNIWLIIYRIYIYRREGLSIPAYFIPAHVDGVWSQILGCCR